MRTSTRLLTFGARFSSASECCPARDCILFCTHKHNPSIRFPNTDFSQLRLRLVAKTSYCLFHFPLVSQLPNREMENMKMKKKKTNVTTHLESIDKACSILLVKSFAQKQKQSNNKIQNNER